MRKIVILGVENSHAHSFLDYIKNEEKYKDVQVVGIYSDDLDAANKLKDEFDVPVMASFDEAVGKVDGVIVTARHGANHYKYAQPYIASGVPMFIDKPITVCGEEAVRFMRECRDAGVKVTGGSCCKHADVVKILKKAVEDNERGNTLSGFVRAPISMDNPYGGFYFYSQHLIEMLCEIFGRYPKSVKAFENKEKYTVVFRYEDYDVTGLYLVGNYKYNVARVDEEGTVAYDADIGRSCFLAEFDEFYEILCGADQKISYDDFISPVFILNAIDESLKTNSEVAVKEFKV